MKKKIYIFTAVFVIFVFGIGAGFIIKLGNNSTYKNVSGYSFELSKKNVINKKLDGKYLNSFVTIVEEQNEYTVNLEGIDESSDIFIINPVNGEMSPMEYDNGKFTTNIKLDKDINYGIIMNFSLIGSIRVMENIEEADNQLFTEMLIGLGCGL